MEYAELSASVEDIGPVTNDENGNEVKVVTLKVVVPASETVSEGDTLTVAVEGSEPEAGEE